MLYLVSIESFCNINYSIRFPRYFIYKNLSLAIITKGYINTFIITKQYMTLKEKLYLQSKVNRRILWFEQRTYCSTYSHSTYWITSTFFFIILLILWRFMQIMHMYTEYKFRTRSSFPSHTCWSSSILSYLIINNSITKWR